MAKKRPKRKNGVTIYEPESIVPITRHLIPYSYELLNEETGELIPTTEDLFTREVTDELDIIKRETNLLLYKHAGQTVPPGNGYSNAKAREFFRGDEITLPVEWKEKYRVQEIIRTNAYDTLSSYSEKINISRAFEFLGWDASYDSVNKCIQDAIGTRESIKTAHYSNIQRAGKAPRYPEIYTPRLLLTACNDQLSKVHVDWGARSMTVDVIIKSSWYRLKYRIPPEIVVMSDNIESVARPMIQWDDNGGLLHVIVFKKRVDIPPRDARSIITFDLGKMDDNPFVAARVFSDGRVSEAILPSAKTMSVWEDIQKLYVERDFVSAKMDRVWWNNHETRDGLDEQYEGITDKITRLKSLLSWLIAEDLEAIARPGEPIVTEDLSWLVGSGVWNFSEIVDSVRYKCLRAGREFALVSASYNSRTCPCCGVRIVPSSDRRSFCECGWVANRDLSACAVMGRKYFRFSRARSRFVRVGRNISKRERVRSVSRGDEQRSSGVLSECGVRCSGVSRRASVRAVERARDWVVLPVRVRVLLLDCLVSLLCECFGCSLGSHVAGGVSLLPKRVRSRSTCCRSAFRRSITGFNNSGGRGLSGQATSRSQNHTIQTQPIH